jgi:hypothetical protein
MSELIISLRSFLLLVRGRIKDLTLGASMEAKEGADRNTFRIRIRIVDCWRHHIG